MIGCCRAPSYDAELTLSMPVRLSVVSGLNALAHAIDSLWAPRANPASTGLATEGIRLLAEGLPAVSRRAQDLWARERVLAGAYLAASAFAGAGSGMHHKICHVLGGRFDLPTHRCMPWCSRMWWRATHQRPRRRSRGSPKRWDPTMPRRG